MKKSLLLLTLIYSIIIQGFIGPSPATSFIKADVAYSETIWFPLQDTTTLNDASSDLNWKLISSDMTSRYGQVSSTYCHFIDSYVAQLILNDLLMTIKLQSTQFSFL
ncbi:hypothetical protein AJ85_19550 [Alkalihalobacillus alcalophilus ATCC 27647 = CGMCC 1.3604]|uniref:Uncharacterized protein n=1 Tax=Alkalihalobacillus alcalophilus ATCC 27647 = CGMCC 1.3604 TaxID=1218173 RepID=A0A094YUK3_ALKAL|nr:hypothetical protein BALCAV_0211740 [Alkalihalobacillus alcalophilus ATCC 27647 = CGMCC 1.3604]THG89103.1 hypothetical protein AJ85_19550 [Alkalihalobacillus alcalophilus ATCC 27647 = CGMCC 1.3604]